MEEGEFLYQKAGNENQTHAPPSSSLDALSTELLEALWRAGSKFIITIPVIVDCIKDLLEIGRPPAYKTKTLQCILEEGEFLYQKTPKKFRAPGEDQNNNPPSSSSNHRAHGGSMASRLENYLITTPVSTGIWDLLIG